VEEVLAIVAGTGQYAGASGIVEQGPPPSGYTSTYHLLLAG
jgi:hypothetical protein